MGRPELYHETAREALAAWDRGDIVWTIEMGGLGPGYEQCIAITTMEAIRAFVHCPEQLINAPDNGTLNRRLDEALWANARVKGLGLSGAQAGAAKNLAYHALKNGWRATLLTVEPERRIMISDQFTVKHRA